MRIFVALDLDDHLRHRIQRFVEGVSGFAPQARWLRPQSLHLTLKFIGEKPGDSVERIKVALSSVQSRPLEIAFRGYGFFPGLKLPRVFWIGVNAGPELASLAAAVDQALLPVEASQEIHAFSPHITLARAGSGGPRRQKGDRLDRRFDRLQQKLALLSPPEFGTMTAREFFLYESRLSGEGPRYIKISRFELQ